MFRIKTRGIRIRDRCQLFSRLFCALTQRPGINRPHRTEQRMPPLAREEQWQLHHLICLFEPHMLMPCAPPSFLQIQSPEAPGMVLVTLTAIFCLGEKERVGSWAFSAEEAESNLGDGEMCEVSSSRETCWDKR